jgi:uncharacterized protein
MGKEDVIAKLRVDKSLLGEFSIKALYLFGSVVRGEENQESDIDILVEFDPEAHVGLFKFGRLQRRLSEIVGRTVDLTTPEALHPALRGRILEKAVHAA